MGQGWLVVGDEEVYSLEEAIPRLDVLYMTRIQKERFSSEGEYERQKNVYVLDRYCRIMRSSQYSQMNIPPFSRKVWGRDGSCGLQG